MKPKRKYLRPLLWILKLYWQASKLALVWIVFKTIFDGLIQIVVAYGMAQFIAGVSAVAFQKGSADTVYFWIFALLAIALLKQVIRPIDTLIKKRLDNRIEISSGEHFINKMYELSQEQFENQEFNTKLDRARVGFYRLFSAISTISSLGSSLIGFVGAMVVVFAVAPVMGIIMIISMINALFIAKFQIFLCF